MPQRRNWDKVRRENLVRLKGAERINDLTDNSYLTVHQYQKAHPFKHRWHITQFESQWRQC